MVAVSPTSWISSDWDDVRRSGSALLDWGKFNKFSELGVKKSIILKQSSLGDRLLVVGESEEVAALMN